MDHPLRLHPSQNTASTPGAHSRACANCARAKAKCVPKSGGDKCGRCDRLNKHCQPAVPIRKPRTVKKPPTNTTARLEEKLDGLFSLLKSGAQPNTQPSVVPDAPSSTDLDTTAGTYSDTQSDAKSGAGAGAVLVADTSTLLYQHPFCSVSTNGTTHFVCLESPDPRTGRLPDKDVFVNPPANFFQPGRSAPPSSASTAYHTPDNITSSHPYPSPDEAKDLLSIFENRMLRYFPFMKMPSYKNSHDFRNEHPFLFLCIMAVASRTTEQQVALGKEIRLILGRKMLTESERTLDLLFGLLVYSGWLVILSLSCSCAAQASAPGLFRMLHSFHSSTIRALTNTTLTIQMPLILLSCFQVLLIILPLSALMLLSFVLIFMLQVCETHGSSRSQTHIHTNPIVTNLVQLAIGLLGDLGLKKSPLKQAPNLVLSYDVRDCPKPFNLPKRTSEERRVAVGVFWISSVLSTHFQRIEPLRWTPYLDDCLQVLSESGDCPTDIVFGYLVRLQLLTEKALSLTSHDDLGVSRSPGHLPTGFYIKSLLVQLETIKRGIPLGLQQNETLLLQIYITELSIQEIALSSTPPTSSVPNFERGEALFGCLRATKNWFDVFLLIPPAVWAGFSMSIYTQLAHCLITLYRLSTLEAVDWDQGLARETIDYSAILGETIKRIKQVKEAAGLDIGISESVDIYTLAAHRFQTIKEWWDAKIAMEAAPLTLNDDAKDDLCTEYVDDAWLKDILGMGWEEYQAEYMQTL